MTLNETFATIELSQKRSIVSFYEPSLEGLKSRAVRHSEYRIADGNPEYAFVHVNLLIREGRPVEVQKDAAQRVMSVLKELFGQRYENGYLSLSVDIKEMREGIAITQHNIPDVGKQK